MAEDGKVMNALIESADFGYSYEGRVFVAKIGLSLANRMYFQYGGSINLSKEGIGSVMRGLMRVTDSENWSEVAGKHVRVCCDDDGDGPVRKIGHIMREDWMSVEDEVKKERSKAVKQ